MVLQEARFRQHRVQAMLRELLTQRLEGQEYDPVRGSQTTKQLAGALKCTRRQKGQRCTCMQLFTPGHYFPRALLAL